MPLGTEIGLGPGHIVLDGDPPTPKRGTVPQFSAHVCCGQIAGWIKMPLGTLEGLGQRTYTNFGYGAQCACGVAN